MLQELISDPQYVDYHYTFEKGQEIFFEGDQSDDLFVLISGRINVFKGRQKITEIHEAGSVFGEMSMLLEGHRTATLRAKTPVKVLRIPHTHIQSFLRKYPELSENMTNLLAQRLEETTVDVFGCKELGDQIPDAVIFTNKEGQILSMNRAAERLYDLDIQEVEHTPVEAVFKNPDDFKKLFSQCASQGDVQDVVFGVNHPVKEDMFVSISIKCLRHANEEHYGFLLIGRDVSRQVSFENKFKRIRKFLLPAALLLIAMLVGLLFVYPYFTKGYKLLGERKKTFAQQVSRDFSYLSDTLASPEYFTNTESFHEVIRSYFFEGPSFRPPYEGVILLNSQKIVVQNFLFDQQKPDGESIGVSYADVEFRPVSKSQHYVLASYHVDEIHPMGQKKIELAYKIHADQEFLGWLLFQLDINQLNRHYAITEEDLYNMRFN